MTGAVQVRELAAWGFDPSPHRPPSAQRAPAEALAHRPPYTQSAVLADGSWQWLRDALEPQLGRADLQAEMSGFDWSLEVVDLTSLLSFQRRLAFDPKVPRPPLPAPGCAEQWIAYALGPPQLPVYQAQLIGSRTLQLSSFNPNLQIRLSPQPTCADVHCGSPLVEVAEFRGRWFLRDGYHRAYDLLLHGLTAVPAVVIQARTLQDLGATHPFFFPEATLCSPRPPRLVDFLEDRLTLTYARPRIIKTLRLTVAESFAPEPNDDPGESR